MFLDANLAFCPVSASTIIMVMSSATLKMGVERLLQHHIPEILLVEGVDDPNSEIAPYYSGWK